MGAKTIGVGECRVCHNGRSLLKTHICPECAKSAPVIETVRAARHKVFVPTAAAESLLMQYSEWLDGKTWDTSSTHTDLVKEFLAQRNPEANPKVI